MKRLHPQNSAIIANSAQRNKGGRPRSPRPPSGLLASEDKAWKAYRQTCRRRGLTPLPFADWYEKHYNLSV